MIQISSDMDRKVTELMSMLGHDAYTPGVLEIVDHIVWLRPIVEQLERRHESSNVGALFHHAVVELFVDVEGRRPSRCVCVTAVRPLTFKITQRDCSGQPSAENTSAGVFDLEQALQTIDELLQL